MLYCRKHDLAFCSTHENECFDNCKLEEESKAEFCAVCSGILKKKEDLNVKKQVTNQ
jgi:hypothetical protein